MRILLIRYHDKDNINTRLPESLNRVQGVLPPLGISYIAAILEKNGYEVGILDAIASNLTKDETRDYIKKERPDVVGVTTMTSNIRGALEAASVAKESGATVVIGGPQLSVYPKETLSYDFIDYGVIGEGEYTMLELVKALQRKESIEDIKGLIFKKDGEVHVNEPAIVHDLDSLPFPARHLLPMEKYSSIIGLHPVTTMMSMRGCPFKCAYCFKQPTDKQCRFRSARNVVDEMEQVAKDYGVREIMFYDDTFTIRRSHVVGICEEILRRGLKVKWEAPTRADVVDAELLKLMHRAGCIRLRYGVESGDPSILKAMNKGVTLPQVKEVFKWTKEAGIEAFAYFMIAYIGETPETITRTISFAKELDPDLVMFTVTTPYPETPLFNEAAEKGMVDRDYWHDFTLGRRSDRLPYFVEDADQWTKKAYRKFYLRPSYILKKVAKIRSWDTLKKHFWAAEGLLLFKMRQAEG